MSCSDENLPTTTPQRTSTRSGVTASTPTGNDATVHEPIPAGDATRAAAISAIVGKECQPPATLLAPYGTKDVAVDASTYWTSTGLYLRKTEHARINTRGSWTIWKGVTQPFGPAGLTTLTPLGGCPKGALVAKVGLAAEASTQCIGAGQTLTADREGIVYLAMNDDASPSYHDGTVTATIASDGDQVPVVALADVATYDYCAVGAGWVELRSGGSLLLTVPAALADKERTTIAASLAKLDRYYSIAQQLAGGDTPFEGQVLRLYPEFDGDSHGWMVAGNPLRLDPRNLNAVEPSKMRLLNLEAADSNLFDIVRALGVTFSRARGGRYQADDAAAQAWGGLFALYANDKEPFGGFPRAICEDQAAQAASGTFAAFVADPWLQLCQLTALQKKYGWSFFTKFFQALPASRTAWDATLPAGSNAAATWAWLKIRLDAAAGENTGPLWTLLKQP